LHKEEFRDGRTDLKFDEVDELLARRAEQLKAASSRATESLARALQSAGYAVDRRGEGAPIVYATLPVGFVKQFGCTAVAWSL
jgi:predicted enzyme involved in methoxymalonyl-ACP biosynthesis